MLRRVTVFIFCFLLFALLQPQEARAKRLLPRAQPTSPSTGTATPRIASRGVNISVKFRADRRAIVATFSNLNIASSVSYQLTYTARGVPQGAGGTVSTGDDPTTRTLLFGTCSGGVCRYDTGITGARFQVTTTLPNGLKIVKPFRLRV